MTSTSNHDPRHAITVAQAMTKEDNLADVTREYRNLIHPGRAERLRLKCDRAPAYTAVAALDRVVADLTEKFASP